MKRQYARPRIPMLLCLSICMIAACEGFQFRQDFGSQLRPRYRQSLDKYSDAFIHRSIGGHVSPQTEDDRVASKRTSDSRTVGDVDRPRVLGQRSVDVHGNGRFLQIKEAPAKLVAARQNGHAVLECSAAGSPAPKITWFKDGAPVYSNEEKMFYHSIDGEGLSDPTALAVSHAKLVIDCVTEKDAGFYECVANQKDGPSKSVETELHVVSYENAIPCRPNTLNNPDKSAPKVNEWMETYMLEMGKDALLKCKSFGATSTMWVGPDEQRIENGSKFSILSDGSLAIYDLKFEDMGIYQCIVKNKFGHDMAETFVYPLASM